MENRLTIKNNNGDLAIYTLLVTATSKWLYEGILAVSALQLVLLLLGVVLLPQGRRLTLTLKSPLWLIYIFSIVLNLVLSGSSFDTWGRAAIVIMTALYAIFLDCESFNVRKILSFISRIGIFHALMVMVHFVLRDRFNSLYFPLLNSANRNYAYTYYRSGYFFGILDSPHEVAGLIAFSIMLIVFQAFVSNKHDIKQYILVGVLLIALLLTGKKGVLICAVAAIALTLFILFGSKKQWHKLFFVLCLLVAGVIALRYLVMAFPNNALFYRLNQYLTKLASGDTNPSTRDWLYGFAIQEWRDHPFFGIGWRSFKGLTTTKYGFGLAHEVNCDYLQWLCEMGTIGFILNMIPILITVWRTLAVCRRGLRRITDNVTKWSVLFAACVQMFTLAYAIVEIPFYDIMFFAMYIISCIIINSAYRKMKRTGTILFGSTQTETA